MNDYTRKTEARTMAYDKTWKSPSDFADYLLLLADDYDDSGMDSSADDHRLAARYIKENTE